MCRGSSTSKSAILAFLLTLLQMLFISVCGSHLVLPAKRKGEGGVENRRDISNRSADPIRFIWGNPGQRTGGAVCEDIGRYLRVRYKTALLITCRRCVIRPNSLSTFGLVPRDGAQTDAIWSIEEYEQRRVRLRRRLRLRPSISRSSVIDCGLEENR